LDPSNICIPCPSGCSECDVSGLCSGCLIGFGLDEKLFQCIECSENCATCSHSSQCLTCKTGFYLVEDSNICTSECPTNYFISEGTCSLCQENCATCE